MDSINLHNVKAITYERVLLIVGGNKVYVIRTYIQNTEGATMEITTFSDKIINPEVKKHE